MLPVFKVEYFLIVTLRKKTKNDRKGKGSWVKFGAFVTQNHRYRLKGTLVCRRHRRKDKMTGRSAGLKKLLYLNTNDDTALHVHLGSAPIISRNLVKDGCIISQIK